MSLAIISAVLLFVGMVSFTEVGRRMADDRSKQGRRFVDAGPNVVEGAIFGLLGLLIAFSFSGAASRFDDRQAMIIQEANSIGTAYLRLDLMPVDVQPQLRDLFRSYLDARMSAYGSASHVSIDRAFAPSAKLQQEIWSRTIGGLGSSQKALVLLVPAINEMFDIAATRVNALRRHPPEIITAMLFGLSIISAFIAGLTIPAGSNGSWLRHAGFAIVTSMTFYVILDLEYPREGLIRVDEFDQVLVELRNSMN